MTDAPALVPIRTRWRHVGGDVLDCFDRRVPLAEAARQAQEWRELASAAEERGEHAIARLYARDALALSAPASLAYEWRRAAGWRDPYEADYPESRA